jgi:hypothetical protein
MCCLIDGVIKLIADGGCHPWLHWIERDGHAGLTLLYAIRHGHATTVDRNIPVVAKMEECIVQHSREPRVFLAHGTKPPILSDIHQKAQQ